MKYPVVIGVVCLARKTFDYKAAEQIYQKIQGHLEKIENVTFECIPNLIIELSDARDAAFTLADKKIDGLICISGTFHLGHLLLEINKKIDMPIYLWGQNELPYDGGKIRLNSVCGVNLNASNLLNLKVTPIPSPLPVMVVGLGKKVNSSANSQNSLEFAGEKQWI